MESVTAATLRTFLERLGERYQGSAALYLLGRSALCLLGNPRVTGDVDYAYGGNNTYLDKTTIAAGWSWSSWERAGKLAGKSARL